MTFAGLWCEADDTGRGIADARLLKGAIWALDDDVTPQAVENHLQELAREHIVLYTVDGERYYSVINWETHQSAAMRRGEALHPAPPATEQLDLGLHDFARGRVQESAGGGRRDREKGEEEGAPDSPVDNVTVLRERRDSSSFDLTIQILTEAIIDGKPNALMERSTYAFATARNLREERAGTIYEHLADGKSPVAIAAMLCGSRVLAEQAAKRIGATSRTG